MRICVLIPVYNEAKNIFPLVQAIHRHIPDVIVVDDGSSDETLELAKQAQAIVLHQSANQGKGASLRLGFDYTLKQGFEWILTMDGDGQHSPNEITHFLEASRKEEVHLIIGNRMNQKSEMPWIRRMTNQCMSKLISLIVKQGIPDTQCGYRLIHRKVLENILLKSNKFEIESELVIEAARAGFKVVSIPIDSIYGPEESQVRPFRDTLRFLGLLLRTYRNRGNLCMIPFVIQW